MAQPGLTNIGMRERRIRNALGYAMLVIAMAMAVLLLTSDAARLWRLMVILPAFLGVRALYDARLGVETIKAELGQERMAGVFTTFGDPIADQEKAAQIRRISRTALVRSVLGALVFTIVILVVP